MTEEERHVLVSLSTQIDDAHAALDLMGIPSVNEANIPLTLWGRLDYLRDNTDRLTFGIFGPYLPNQRG